MIWRTELYNPIMQQDSTRDRTSGRHWFITGISSGFGRAVAEAAVHRGDRVTGTVRTEQARAAILRDLPPRLVVSLLDVTDEAAVRGAVAAAERDSGPIDILVNNAGYGLVAGVEEASLAEVRTQFEVNVFGAIAVLQAVLPCMRARRAGRIINISSVSGLVGWAALGIYSGSKFALEGICESLSQEVAPLGIHVTLIEPGGFRTNFAGRSRAESARRIEDYHASVGANRRLLQQHAGHERGDPARAALAILAIADHTRPPLRLMLGEDALGYVERKFQQQAAEIEEWKALTRSTDFSTG
jgi:NAD(P)-dependent dehydrogenase (short-subunit alcohol dehydrogenase family)